MSRMLIASVRKRIVDRSVRLLDCGAVNGYICRLFAVDGCCAVGELAWLNEYVAEYNLLDFLSVLRQTFEGLGNGFI